MPSLAAAPVSQFPRPKTQGEAQGETQREAQGLAQGEATEHAAGPWRRATLQIGAIIAVGAAVVTLLWLIIVVVLDTERRAAIDHARSEASNLSAAFRAEVTGKLDGITRAMDVIAAQMRRDHDFDLYQWAQANPLLTATTMQAAAIISPNGELVTSTLMQHPAKLNLTDQDYFRAQVRPGVRARGSGLFISELGVARPFDQPGLRISRRVDGPDGRLLGVLVFSIATSHLTSLPLTVDLGPRGYLTLIGTDNVMRARFGTDSANGEVGAGDLVPLPMLASKNGARVQTFIRRAVVDHRLRVYSVRGLSDYPLYVSVGLDLDQVLQPAAAHARLIVVIGLIATLMLGGLITLLIIQTRRRTDREVKLRQEQARLATEIGHGNAVQAQLRASEARLRDIAMQASDWFWEQDASLRYVAFGGAVPNGALEDNSHIGKYRWEWADSSNASELWASHRRDLEAHKPFRDFRYSQLGADGRLRHISSSGVPVYDDAGQFVGYRGTGRDITAEVAAAAELRAAKDRAEQAETLLRDAVDSISEGFVIFDRHERFVMCNEPYRQMYPGAAELLRPGLSFADLLRHLSIEGAFPDARGHEAEWVAERLRRYREAAGASEQRRGDGAWMLVIDRRMKSGGIAGLRIDISALKQTQAALRESEARLDRAQAIAGVGSWELDLITGDYSWSKELYRIRGVSEGQFTPRLDNIVSFVHPDDFVSKVHWLDRLRLGIEPSAQELRLLRPDGEERVVRVEGRAVIDDDGVIRRLAGTMQDITERRLMERQLMQAQKMEAIGNLTGGMAHDFNNGLGIIIGNLDLLARTVKGNKSAEDLCGEARNGAVRCAELVRQLLAFARRQPLQPRQTDVNALVHETIALLRRTLGEHITLTPALDAAMWPVLADPVQLEAALVNLATNARDAMPNGGHLDISTRNVCLDEHYAALNPEAAAGEYALIEVSDTGTGIAPEIVGRIFEPFFTTKAPGRGSGLGLSMVFGFVKQSNGHMTVYSEPGRGSTFRIYLPRMQAGGADAVPNERRSPVVGGHETVLVVEDNEQLRRATVRQLTTLGYHVMEVADVAAARVVLGSDMAIDLLFTDVVMPGELDGIGLARQALFLRPGLRVLLTSGFPAARAHDQRTSTTRFRLLAKPYHRDELARALRDALDSPHVPENAQQPATDQHEADQHEAARQPAERTGGNLLAAAPP